MDEDRIKEKVEKLIYERGDYASHLRAIDRELAELVMTYQGSVLSALKSGLVRLNFPAPAGFYRAIRQ